MGKKQAKYKNEPQPVKVAKIHEPTIDGGKHLSWRFSGCDKGGPFCWANFESAEKFREVIERLHEFETKNWHELEAAGSHTIPTYQLDKAAQKRLTELERDDVDELMSFRIAGANRIWCVKTGHVMHILWWDPNHAVYPVERDRADRVKRWNRR